MSQTFVIFLSNRVHPDGKGDVTPLRAKVATVVASAIEDTPIEAFRLGGKHLRVAGRGADSGIQGTVGSASSKLG